MRHLYVQLLLAVTAVLGFLASTTPAQGVSFQSVWEQKISDTAGGFAGGLPDGAAFGTGITSLGDLNGDGFEDVAVGSPMMGTGGVVWILFQDYRGQVQSSVQIGSAQLGNTVNLGDWFGWSVANIGDLDADGVTDLAIGAPQASGEVGAFWVVFLNANATVKAFFRHSTTQFGFQQLGSSLCPMGDFDGDGNLDLAVGAKNYASTSGTVWIYFLLPNGNKHYWNRIQNVGGINGPDQFGYSVAHLDDLNGNGYVEIAVGAPFADIVPANDDNRGKVHILELELGFFYPGAPYASTRSQIIIGDGLNGFPSGVLDDDDLFGTAVSAMGDARADDGIRHVAVGAALDDDGGVGRGAVWLLHVDPYTYPYRVWDVQKISSTSGGLQGPLDDSDVFGCSLALMSRSDAVTDLVVGAHYDDDGGPNRGAVYELKVFGYTGSARFRNNALGSPNPVGYTTEIPHLGLDWWAKVTNVGTNTYAQVVGYSAPLSLFLAGYGEYLLIDTASPYLFATAVGSGQTISFYTYVPYEVAFVGLSCYTQAVAWGGTTGVTLHNAYDVIFGY
ncbi:MAG: hypothetical protein AB1726_15175 [Planctomycetota bacterium]